MHQAADDLRAAARRAEAAVDAALDLALDLAARAEDPGEAVDPETAAAARRDALALARALRALADRAHGMARLVDPPGDQ
ncbi:MAG: hypothetical protein MUE51_04135 [Thermoleophilia bacterium]|jgi:hypothetical protein|nr:hypothetical protein [Thermoleophilia bacterium]